MRGERQEKSKPDPVSSFPLAAFHDLKSLAEQVRAEYFPQAPMLAIRWGNQIERKRRRSIRLGSYNHRTREVRIHPRLNSSDIPQFFVQSIIHHEYLHHLLGAKHNRRFHQKERRFRFHRQSRTWLRANLSVLLGLPRARRVIPRPSPAASPIVRWLQLPLFAR